MLEADKNLPDLPMGLGHLTGNVASVWGKGDTAKAITKWNEGAQFLAGEAAKMVKNGVASEKEV